MSDNSIKAAWISGSLGLVGAIIGAIILFHGNSKPAPSPPSPTTASPVSTASSPINGVPSSYQGTWTGVVTQSVGNPYELTLKIGSGGVGSAIGSWQVPTLNCTGVVYLESGGGPLELQQVTDLNANDLCYAHFTADVTLQGSDLSYQIIGATSVNGQFYNGDQTPLATSTLSPTG
jgi:hypothetical protein